MSDGKYIDALVEPILIIVSFVIYLEIAIYNMVPTTSPYYILSGLALAAGVGISVIYIITVFLGFYGVVSKKEKEMHETSHLARLILYPILILVLLKTLNISIASLLVGAGFLGIIVGLAAQTSLGNIFASFSIMYSRPFTRGEKITVVASYGVTAPTYPHEKMMNEITGTVRHIGLIYTRIMRDDMSMLYIPNAAINQGLIINHSRATERQIKIRLEAKRKTDIDTFRKKLLSKLSKNLVEYDKLKELETSMSLISTESNYGIFIKARVKTLDYDRLSQWVSENAINSLNDVEKKK